MLSLQLVCRTLQRQVSASHVSVYQAAAALAPYMSGLLRGPHRNMRTSCMVKMSVDEDSYFIRGSKPNRSQEPRIRTSVFSAGSSKKRAARHKEDLPPSASQDATTLSSTKVIPLPTKPLGSLDWGQLNEQFSHIRNFEDRVIEQMLKMGTDLNIAKSFLSYIAEKDGDINYKLLVKYLVLCVQNNHSAEVCDLYDIMKMKFETFDTGASSLFIRGLSKTNRWRESIALLETLKKVGPVSARNYADCVKAAIEHQEAEFAWTLYREMLQSNLLPPEDAIVSLFDAAQTLQDDNYRESLIAILRNFREDQIYPGESLVRSIKCWFESIPNENWRGNFTKATDSGHCQSCKQQLESIHLMPEEYNSLKKAVIDSIIKGEDTFRKTTPQELEAFLRFVDARRPYDIVVDGLNVAYLTRKGCLSQTLLDVVLRLTTKGRRVLVLGRKHMLVPSKKWVKQDIQRIQERADCFFLDNVSLDDPFLLYACLNSGSHCCFLTSDLLRDHKACLPDTETKHLFCKWQRGHQLVIPSYTHGSVNLRPILNYDTIVQNTEDSWHIPYDSDNVERASFEVPKTWLCLRRAP